MNEETREELIALIEDALDAIIVAQDGHDRLVDASEVAPTILDALGIEQVGVVPGGFKRVFTVYPEVVNEERGAPMHPQDVSESPPVFRLRALDRAQEGEQ